MLQIPELYDENRRAVILAVHPLLANELRMLKHIMEKENNFLPPEGGYTTYSKILGEQIRQIRLGNKDPELRRMIFESKNYLKEPLMYKNFEDQIIPCIPLGLFKKLYLMLLTLNSKKDQQKIRLEISKMKGIQKNDVKFIY